MTKKIRQIDWFDIPEISATLTQTTEHLYSCGVSVNGNPIAHIFLTHDGQIGMIEINDLSAYKDFRINIERFFGRLIITAIQEAKEGVLP